MDAQSRLEERSHALVCGGRRRPGSARVQSEYGRVLMGRAERPAQAGRTADAERLYADAQAHFETALKIYPSYSLPMDGLATILSLHQRFDEAIVLYERAVQVWPGNYASLTNWAGLLWDRATRTAAQASALRAKAGSRKPTNLTRRPTPVPAGGRENRSRHRDDAVLCACTPRSRAAPRRLPRDQAARSRSSRRCCA